jgi:hypothetical protein
MSLKKIIDTVLTRKEFSEKPPVLMDIGASGGLHEVWKYIAPHAICIAFDADSRDLQLSEKEVKGFRKIYVFNRIATDKKKDTTLDFYLTQNPHCSSTLKPLAKDLSEYHFAPYFEIDKIEKLPAITLPEVLDSTQLNYIDWFKTDTQGTDLRLFNSLPADIKNQILSVELEPGIIDAYEGEDKLTDVLDTLSKTGYQILNFNVRGPIKLKSEQYLSVFNSNLKQKLAKNFLTQIPGWVELSFTQSLDNQHFTLREWLLSWVFTTVQGHHAAAYSIAEKGLTHYKDAQLSTLKNYSEKAMQKEIFSLSNMVKATKLFFKNL